MYIHLNFYKKSQTSRAENVHGDEGHCVAGHWTTPLPAKPCMLFQRNALLLKAAIQPDYPYISLLQLSPAPPPPPPVVLFASPSPSRDDDDDNNGWWSSYLVVLTPVQRAMSHCHLCLHAVTMVGDAPPSPILVVPHAIPRPLR